VGMDIFSGGKRLFFGGGRNRRGDMNKANKEKIENAGPVVGEKSGHRGDPHADERLDGEKEPKRKELREMAVIGICLN